MHTLCQLYAISSKVLQRNTDASKWFLFDKKSKNQSLVETNMKALNDIFKLDQQKYKEAIGSLSLKKLAERIESQLSSSAQFTQMQHKIMK